MPASPGTTQPPAFPRAHILLGLVVASFLLGATTTEALGCSVAAAGVPDSAVPDLIDRGRFASAESLAWIGLESAESRSPADSIQIATALDNLAFALLENGHGGGRRALGITERAVGIRERAFGTESPAVVPSLLQRGKVLYEVDRYPDAVAALERALRLSRIPGVGPPPDSIEVIHQLAAAYLYVGKPDLARTFEARAYELRMQALGPDHPSLARNLALLGVLAWGEGKADSAFARYDRAVDVLQRKWGPDHPRIALILEWKGNGLRFANRVQEAKDTFDRAIQIQERTLRPDHPSYAATLRAAAANLLYMTKVDEAKRYFDKSFGIIEREYGKGSLEHAWALVGMGEFQLYVGDIAAARASLEEALEVHQRRIPESNLTAVNLRILGGLLLWFGWPEEGRKYYEAALSIYKKSFSNDNPNMASAIYGVAAALHMAGELGRSRAMVEQALAIYRRIHGPEATTVADCLRELGTLARDQGRSEEAIQYLEKALAILDKKVGHASSLRITAAYHLAGVYHAAGRLTQARRLMEEALDGAIANAGPGHPWSFMFRRELASILSESGYRDAAIDTALEAANASVPYFRRAYRMFPENQSLTFGRQLPLVMGTLLDLACNGKPLSTPRATRTYEMIIRSRALILEESALRVQALRRSTDPELADLESKLAVVSQRLANLEVRATITGASETAASEVSPALLRDTRRERERLELVLWTRSQTHARQTQRDQIGFAEVARALPPRSALVSYVYWNRAGLGGQAGAYAAFVLRAGEPEAKLVPLGSAQSVEESVNRWIRLSGSPPPGSGSSLRKAEAACRLAGERLRREIWDPLQPHLVGVTRVFCVPDGALHVVSFGALPSSSGGYLAETSPSFHYLSAERDLVQDAKESGPAGEGLLALGGPDFDSVASIGASGQVGAAVDSPRRGSIYRGPHSRCELFRGIRFGPIQDSRREVEEIARIWTASHVAGEVVELAGQQASEDAFKSLASGRRVLHLATHGFVVDERCSGRMEGTRGVGYTAPAGYGPSPGATVNPGSARDRPSNRPEDRLLVLAGLAFAGANLRDQATVDQEDGILTAEEITAIDLTGVEWVVLSACESGRGAVRVGEGVMGLRRAFQVAGARTTIMSLWPVEDKAAREWMRALYEARLLRRLDTAESIQEATRTVLAARRSRGESTHPFYWGAFVAAGSWE